MNAQEPGYSSSGKIIGRAPTRAYTRQPRVSPASSPLKERSDFPHARGFTLIELLVTVAIVALLASIGLPLAELAVQRDNERELRRSLREMREAIDAYKIASDEGRIERAADRSGYPPNLNALVEGVTDAKNPKGDKIYFLRRIPRDPLSGEPPDAAPERAWGLRSYESPPDSPRPGRDVFDVYTLNPGTGLNGVPYRDW